jgi:cyclopropane fatty-acyl-phospholipid synthase-like methyltransferase
MGAYTRLSPKMLQLSQFTEVGNLLDVGGGDGSNAVRLCRQLPHLRVTVLDIPSVVSIAQATVNRAGLTDRIQCVSADMFVDPWPSGHNAVLLSHVVEIFSPERIRQLYARAYDSLPTQGRLFVWAIMANDSETAALQAAKSSIYFLCVASGEGMAYPAKRHLELMHAAGFNDVKIYSAEEIDHGALVATK